jgi:hypothetical protein
MLAMSVVVRLSFYFRSRAGLNQISVEVSSPEEQQRIIGSAAENADFVVERRVGVASSVRRMAPVLVFVSDVQTG